VIATSNQDNFFHPLDSQSKISGKGKPSIDLLDHPATEIALR
jgi:hypothetical protein